MKLKLITASVIAVAFFTLASCGGHEEKHEEGTPAMSDSTATTEHEHEHMHGDSTHTHGHAHDGDTTMHAH